MNECSIVIRAFNEQMHLGKLLEGLHRQTIRNVEIILVDSGSTDATVAIAENYGATVMHIEPAEFTFGRSLNLGISAANCPKVIIASAHVYPVYPDWLERLLEPFSDPKVVLTYGRQSGDGNSEFSERQIFAHWFPDRSVTHQSHPFCNNANAAIRRSIWEVHPFNESLTGLEDLAWAKWAIENGHVISYLAEAEIIHVHKETPLGVMNRYLREAMAFKQIYPEAHFSLYDFIRMTSANISSDLWHAFHEHVLWQSILSIFWFRTAQFWGTYQGYRRSPQWTWHMRQTFYYPHGMEKIEKSTSRQVNPIRYNE